MCAVLCHCTLYCEKPFNISVKRTGSVATPHRRAPTPSRLSCPSVDPLAPVPRPLALATGHTRSSSIFMAITRDGAIICT